MNKTDWRVAATLFTVISSVYFATVAGITSSNDGSHYALVRALADKRSFEISEYLEFTENQDYALRGDLRFSDRPPGTAILAAPVYALSQVLPPPLVELRSKHDPGNPRLVYALLVPVIAASATAVILFWMLRAHFALPLWSSALTTLAFAFGTMTWKYGSLLYSHATSELAVMAATALILRRTGMSTNKETNKRIILSSGPHSFIRWIFVDRDISINFFLGLLLGLSVLMEYTNIIFVAFAGLYWLWQTFSPSPLLPRSQAKEKIVRLFFFLFGGLLPALFLMWYNAVNFGGPFKLSTFNADTTRWPQNLSFLTDFATPIWVGLPAMLFYGSDNQGLFWLAPISLLGLVGVRGLWKFSRRECVLIIGVFLAMLLLFSTSTTFNPFTNDGRYITPFLGLWFVAVGFGVVRFVGAIHELPLRWAIVYGLLFLSIRNQILHIAFSWGHDLNLATLRPWAAAPENIAALWQAVFPNALNVPLWWGVVAVGWLAWRLRRRRGRAAELESLKH
ncbi:MAG: hypothetical protein HYZ49_10395 [Chloroflexi bacterium]|nr:hypothetical protein [Chloroflexota bacterium]